MHGSLHTKKITLALGICFLLRAVYCFAATVDKILVIVNGETITQSEVDAAMAPAMSKLRKENDPAQLIDEVEARRKAVLNRMIEEKIILSEARKLEIEISDEEVEGKLGEVISRFKSEEAFNRVLIEANISIGDLKKKYTDQLMISKLVEGLVKAKIRITPSDIFNYYEVNKEKYRVTEKIRLKNILIKAQDDIADEQAQGLAQKVLGFLKAGEDFDELVLKYSKGPNADKGGDLGYKEKGELMKKIEDAVFHLEPGAFSDVCKTKLGYHIFMVTDRKEARIKPLEEVRLEIQNAIYTTRMNEGYKKWVEDLKKDAYISFR